MKLEINSERVVEAASKCPTAKETLKTLFPEAFKGEAIYKRGDMFLHKNTGKYILCVFRGHGVLVSLSDGNVWDGGHHAVDNCFAVTRREFDAISANQSEDFKKI